jgi:hypothetical protein
MAWYRLAAGLLRQDDPEHAKIMYWDAGPLHAGELLLWLDADGDVARFMLSHRPFRGRLEHCVEWQRGGEPRFGEVDDGESSGRSKMAPVVRRHRVDAATVEMLRTYFAENAEVLEPDQRAVIDGVLDPDLA